jgi:hypothetical protein
MITTKKTELSVINNFSDLIKDTKEKQRINKLVKQLSWEYFMNKLSDSELEDNQTIYNILQDLSTHNQKYSYIITKKIKEKILDDYSYEEEYYDGSYCRKGQITKTRKVLDRNRVGKDFGESLEEEINNLVLDDYYKNLNKALETYNFNNKIEKLKEKDKDRKLRDNLEEIEEIIERHVNGVYKHYKEKGNTDYEIAWAYRNNKEVIRCLYDIILCSISEDLGIELAKGDIESKVEKEIKRFVSSLDVKKPKEVKKEETKVPFGWKAYAITKFIDDLLK